MTSHKLDNKHREDIRNKSVLVIDDDSYICKLLKRILEKNNFKTDTTNSGLSAKKLIIENQYSLVLCDYRLPDSNGLEILRHLKEVSSASEIIIMTAYEEVHTAVKLIKEGAYDYLTKPLIPDEVISIANEAIKEKPATGNEELPDRNFITGESPGIQKVIEQVDIVAPVNLTIVIEGETGSGKEYLSRLIHDKSKRKNNPFVAVDCGALPEGVVNSELFGHIKGAFTGATSDKTGYFEEANNGTLFLDEITNLNSENQIKLLRVLQENVITKVGDTKPIKIDVRLIVASNQSLAEEVKNGDLREDLYHRLNEFRITLPPLRERGDDIFIFAGEFLKHASKRFGKNVTGFDNDARQILRSYSWPGNIRELHNVITRAVLLSHGEMITAAVLPVEIRENIPVAAGKEPLPDNYISGTELKSAAGQAERTAILKALKETGNNKSEAARLLNIDRKTLYNKLRRFAISSEEINESKA